MALLGKSFRDRDPIRVAIVGLVAVLAIVLLGFRYPAISDHFTSTAYSAEFSEVGELQSGNDVRISGLTVGHVTSVRLHDGHVQVDFVLDKSVRIGTTTRALIGTATVLGTKDLELTPSGSSRLAAHGSIPLADTTAPYDVTQVLSQLTTETGQINTTQLADSLTTLSTTLAKAPPDVASALSGVSRLSTTIASRDQQLQTLLASADSVTGILASRSAELQTLFSDGTLLLGQLNDERVAIQQLIDSFNQFFVQLRATVNENQATLKPALQSLEQVLTTLNQHQGSLVAAINGLQRHAGGLGEAVAGGPFFYAYVQNLGATNLALPGSAPTGSAATP
jgi:phospholipid/cholesterol/gamma-HCH transport system substrate-binding protein